MLVIYPGTYRDHRGAEAIAVENDGKRLRTTIRGVEFTGRAPDALEPSIDPSSAELSQFTLNRWSPEAPELCGCVIDYNVPIPMISGDQPVEAILQVHMQLGEPGGNGFPEPQSLRITLAFRGQVYRGTGTGGDFESELVEIQQALPADLSMKACITCAFSDYSVYGKSTFGDMQCYRDNKEVYLAVGTKREYMEIMGSFTEDVQETYLCPEYERRKAGTGYRG
jgi:hypothetical protein